MRKNRLFSIVLAITIIACVLSGCGSSSKSSTDMAAPDIAPKEDLERMNVNYGDAPYGINQSTANSNSVTPTQTSLPNQTSKLILTASLEIETTQFDKATIDISDLTNKVGGYFENSDVSSYGTDYRYARYTVRLPKEKYNEFLTSISKNCHVTHTNESVENISQTYYDTELRLKTQRTKYDRLQVLLEKAENMEDIIAIESALTDVQFQIEQLEGTLRNYDNLIGYSTISIDLNEVYKLSNVNEAPIGFGSRIITAFKNGFVSLGNTFQSFIIWCAYNFVLIIILAIIAPIIIKVATKKRHLKYKKQEKAETDKDNENNE